MKTMLESSVPVVVSCVELKWRFECVLDMKHDILTRSSPNRTAVDHYGTLIPQDDWFTLLEIPTYVELNFVSTAESIATTHGMLVTCEENDILQWQSQCNKIETIVPKHS